ncbi:hypothetical protein BG015_010795 [Linnemannia schmuckeri]|uniref:Uncharacterized protein n=1 Tax=Linnemannia schmuckeri TaxID=64567 RepID=A0A9P5V8M1_9FUNG|nr:hypothetical protein BG015_010795 [Linnemannia schmuckeri]
MSASWLPAPLIPPFRFGTVEPEVYRGAYPKQRNLRYLKRLKLKTILSLVPDEPDEVFQEFCQGRGIRPIHLPVDKVKDNVPLTYNRAVEAVQIIIDPDNLPIYIHCLDGAVVTGLVVCCLRKLQTWNISSAMGEFLRFLRGGVISSEESVFVEKFGSEIEISKPIPPWLWEGQITFKKHPTLKLNFTIPPSEASSTSGAGAGAVPSTLQGGGTGGTNLGYHTSTSSSPSMSGSQHGGTAVVLLGQGDNSQHSGNGSGQLANSSSGNSISSLGSTGSTIAGAGGTRANINSNAATATASASGSGLMNHASRSSAKGGSRDRPGTSKSNIRTDLQGQSTFAPRSSSIATPTTASQAQVRGKRTLVDTQGSIVGGGGGSPAVIGEGDHGLTEDSGLGVRINTIVPGAEGSNAANAGEVDADGQAKSAVISISHDQGERDQSTATAAGKDFDSTTKETNTNSTNTGPSITQERTSGTKNSPASTSATVVVPEVVDEYYEVSMTLKALALEGADF